MTNHDFWMSISDIINEGFTSEGLAKIFAFIVKKEFFCAVLENKRFTKPFPV